MQKEEGGRASELHTSSFLLHTWHSGGQGNPTYYMKQAIAVMHEKHGIACDMMHGFDQPKPVAMVVDKKLSGVACVHGGKV